MNISDLPVRPREGTGKGAARRLRRAGLVPAILYGARTEPVSLTLSPVDVHRVLHGHAGGGVLVSLKLGGEAEARTAVVRELQWDPVRDTLVHVDLQAVRMDEEITVEVPVQVVGEAEGVRDQSGILQLLLRTIEVACLPAQIPERLQLDVTALRIHDVLTVADITAPEGVRLVTAGTQAVVTVAPPMAEEVAAPVAAAPAAEPEVVTERKPKEEGEEKEGAAPAAKAAPAKEAKESPRAKK